MERVIAAMVEDEKYNHLPVFTRFGKWLWRAKWKFMMLGVAYAGFGYWGNPVGMIAAKLERTNKKYKKRWMLRYCPESYTYPSAMETTWQSSKLSRPSQDILSDMFVKIDREMKHGFSRQLIVDALQKMDLMVDKKEEAKFLRDSGFEMMRNRMLGSLSLKQFLITMENYSGPHELEFVEEFIQHVYTEKIGVSLQL